MESDLSQYGIYNLTAVRASSVWDVPSAAVLPIVPSAVWCVLQGGQSCDVESGCEGDRPQKEETVEELEGGL